MGYVAWHGRYRFTERGRIEALKRYILGKMAFARWRIDFSAADISPQLSADAQQAIEELVKEGILEQSP